MNGKKAKKSSTSIDETMKKYIVKSDSQDMNEIKDLNEQSHSSSGSDIISKVRGRLPHYVDDPPGLAALSGVLTIASAAMSMKDPNRRNKLLALCRNLVGQV